MSTAIQAHVREMRRLTDKADGRPLTKTQQADFFDELNAATKTIKSFEHSDPEPAVKLAKGVKAAIEDSGSDPEAMVDNLERNLGRHNWGVKSMGRLVSHADTSIPFRPTPPGVGRRTRRPSTGATSSSRRVRRARRRCWTPGR